MIGLGVLIILVGLIPNELKMWLWSQVAPALSWNDEVETESKVLAALLRVEDGLKHLSDVVQNGREDSTQELNEFKELKEAIVGIPNEVEKLFDEATIIATLKGKGYKVEKL